MERRGRYSRFDKTVIYRDSTPVRKVFEIDNLTYDDVETQVKKKFDVMDELLDILNIKSYTFHVITSVVTGILVGFLIIIYT
uniref:DUF3227 domain-containing protein n=1 Tax=Parastrongyloides trichosuri TaxID=131310 RepID=A0A0N4ZEM2_PARTI